MTAKYVSALVALLLAFAAVKASIPSHESTSFAEVNIYHEMHETGM